MYLLGQHKQYVVRECNTCVTLNARFQTLDFTYHILAAHASDQQDEKVSGVVGVSCSDFVLTKPRMFEALSTLAPRSASSTNTSWQSSRSTLGRKRSESSTSHHQVRWPVVARLKSKRSTQWHLIPMTLVYDQINETSHSFRAPSVA